MFDRLPERPFPVLESPGKSGSVMSSRYTCRLFITDERNHWTDFASSFGGILNSSAIPITPKRITSS